MQAALQAFQTSLTELDILQLARWYARLGPST